jgi:hypothetical protein
MLVFVLQLDDALLAYVNNTVFLTGGTGFLSAGVGTFDDATLDTICDGGTSCVGM